MVECDSLFLFCMTTKVIKCACSQHSELPVTKHSFMNFDLSPLNPNFYIKYTFSRPGIVWLAFLWLFVWPKAELTLGKIRENANIQKVLFLQDVFELGCCFKRDQKWLSFWIEDVNRGMENQILMIRLKLDIKGNKNEAV